MSQETQLLIFYDLTDNRVRTEIHQFLQNYGINSQKSLFEVQCDAARKKEILRFLKEREPEGEGESILIYEVCRKCLGKCRCSGNSPGLDFKPYQVL